MYWEMEHLLLQFYSDPSFETLHMFSHGPKVSMHARIQKVLSDGSNFDNVIF